MGTDLFQSAATNPELAQEVAAAISSVAALGIVQLAAQDADFKASLTAALQDFASQHKLSFVAEEAASMGLAIESITKFKAHKDNPTQIPIGTPIALLFVSAALLFAPSVLTTAGETLFGAGASEQL